MARTVRNAKIDTRSSRSRLPARREPYWTKINKGQHVGYRKGTKGGTWVARLRDEEGVQHYEAIGAADDFVDADGLAALSFPQAQEKARQWFTREVARLAGGTHHGGPYTVGDAMDDYFTWYKARGGKGAYHVERTIEVHVRPALGKIRLDALTHRKVSTWRDGLVTAAPRLRTKKGAAQKFREIDGSPEAVRRRRSSANKILTVLKAALNHAYREGHVANDAAWARVKAYRGVDEPRIRYLSDEEARRLVNACAEALRSIVVAALLTGCRYGELRVMRCGDFDAEAGTVYVPESKGGRPRHVHLSAEGRTFFEQATAGRRPTDFVFRRASETAWRPSDQVRPLREACETAKIDPPASFHILRHTYGSRLAIQGVPMAVIAAQLGHADTRITEKHYAHLGPSYVASTIRAAFGNLGIVETTNVTPIRRREQKAVAGANPNE